MEDHMDLDLDELLAKAEESFTDEEKARLGIGETEHVVDRGVREQKILYEAIVPLQGKESDSEIAFRFEFYDDAMMLYDYILETGLVVPGEIKIKNISGQNSVHFASNVVVTKPEVIQMAYSVSASIVSGEMDPVTPEDVRAVAEAVKSRSDLFTKATGKTFNLERDAFASYKARNYTTEDRIFLDDIREYMGYVNQLIAEGIPEGEVVDERDEHDRFQEIIDGSTED